MKKVTELKDTVSLTALPDTSRNAPITEEQANKNRIDSVDRATALFDRIKAATCEHKAAELVESLSDDDLDELFDHAKMNFGWALVEGALENHDHIANALVINSNLPDITFYHYVVVLVEEEQDSRFEDEEDANQPWNPNNGTPITLGGYSRRSRQWNRNH